MKSSTMDVTFILKDCKLMAIANENRCCLLRSTSQVHYGIAKTSYLFMHTWQNLQKYLQKNDQRSILKWNG